MNKILLVLDSFKGCLSSAEVERAAAQGVKERYPDCEVVCLPIADGGEGMLDVMVGLTGGKMVEAQVHDALMRPVTARYGILGDGRTAVVEMAQASGLPLLKAEERNPMLTTTYGTGELVAKAIEAGFHRIVMGIGGSATNDAGMGMMQALGARFLDEEEQVLPVGCGQLLGRVRHVDLSLFKEKIKGVHFVTACDVDNPLCGERGASVVFAPQKGASPEMVAALERGMKNYARLMNDIADRRVDELAGAGAAGGLGAGLNAFFGADLRPGIELILEQMRFEELVSGASLVITGEGKADRQTLMGKVPAGVLGASRKAGVPVILLAGAVDNRDLLLSAGFENVVAVTPENMPLSEAMRPEVARRNIKNAVAGLF